MRRAALLAAALLLAGVAVLVASRSAFDPPVGAAALGARLERVVPRSLTEHRVPGASVAIVRQGRVAWARGFGTADVRTGDRVTPGTRFEVGAIAEPVAAMAIQRLAARRGVALDAVLDGPSRGSGPRGLTLARLLSHTAGLSAGGDLAAARRWAEVASGDSFATVARREVLGPLGMTRSGFSRRDPGGLRTTAPDLARFAAAFLPGPGREPPGRGVVAYRIVDAMTRPAPGTGGAYGLGLHLEALDDGTRIARHGGSGRGWESDLVILPGENWAIVVLTNGDGGRAVAADVVAELLG